MFLSIVTPSYNRAHTLPKCYESLLSQTDYDFEWIIVDDGSSDNTKEIAQTFMDNGNFPVRYFHKDNGGKHTALNLGFAVAKGELSMVLDSDDQLLPDAVEIIRKLWRKYARQEKIAGMSFLKCFSDGEVIGDKFPCDEFISDHIQCRINRGICGDKVEVYRTEVLRKYPFPVFEGENFMGESVLWNRIANDYQTVYVNRKIYMCEYLQGGLTKLGRGLRIKNPLGGMMASNIQLAAKTNVKNKIKQGLLYNCYGFFAKKKPLEIIRSSNSMLFSLLLLPGGYFLYRYWKKKYG